MARLRRSRSFPRSSVQCLVRRERACLANITGSEPCLLNAAIRRWHPRLNLLCPRVRRETDRDERYEAHGHHDRHMLATAVFAPGFAQMAMTTIGFLSPDIASTQAAPNAALGAFRQGLADLGYVDGRDFTIEARCRPGETINSPFSLPNLSVKRWIS